jgi:hypothetical protein
MLPYRMGKYPINSSLVMPEKTEMTVASAFAA